MDWKPDNKDIQGKLFDFDGSGLWIHVIQLKWTIGHFNQYI